MQRHPNRRKRSDVQITWLGAQLAEAPDHGCLGNIVVHSVGKLWYDTLKQIAGKGHHFHVHGHVQQRRRYKASQPIMCHGEDLQQQPSSIGSGPMKLFESR